MMSGWVRHAGDDACRPAQVPGGTFPAGCAYRFCDRASRRHHDPPAPAERRATSQARRHDLRPEPVDLIGEGRLMKLGRTLAVGDFTVWSDGMKEPVAHATVTYALPSTARKS